MTEELFGSVYSLNVKVPYFLVATLARLMAKRCKGAIVSVATMVADYGATGMSLYGSSKAAINVLTKAWVAEYGPSGVRVNAVNPGPTRTEGTEAMGKALEQLAAQALAGRPADEIAEAIVFLGDRSFQFHIWRKTRHRWRAYSHLSIAHTNRCGRNQHRLELLRHLVPLNTFMQPKSLWELVSDVIERPQEACHRS